MRLRHFTLIGIALLASATAANAAVLRVFPGDSIQAAIDAAEPGDTILVEPGEYRETVGAENDFFGLRIKTDNLRLVGKVNQGQGEAGKVRLIRDADQQTGVYAAPDGCGPGVPVGGCVDGDGQPRQLQGFYIRGFTVEDFPRNGIQTRFVNDFKIIRNESANNGNVNGNGIYPTISTNGLVLNNVSYGSLDTAMWVAASEHVRVIGNEVYDSVIGLEISVSNKVLVTQNDIHDNTVGVGLFHPNAAGNAQLPVMEDWVIKSNNVYDNNLPNGAPDGSFQKGLPSGVGILLLGVSDHVIANNTVENNDYVGIGILGWCSATAFDPNGCQNEAPQADPSVNNNLISQNELSGNGGSPPGGGMGPLDFLAADITYLSFWPFPPWPESSSGNCFEKNKPKDGFTVSAFSAPPFPPFNGVPIPLPDDGC